MKSVIFCLHLSLHHYLHLNFITSQFPSLHNFCFNLIAPWGHTEKHFFLFQSQLVMKIMEFLNCWEFYLSSRYKTVLLWCFWRPRGRGGEDGNSVPACTHKPIIIILLKLHIALSCKILVERSIYKAFCFYFFNLKN